MNDAPVTGVPGGRPAPSPRTALLLAALVSVSYLALAIPLLGDYGPTWDCAIGEYVLGEQLLHAMTTPGAKVADAIRGTTLPVARQPHPPLDGYRFPWNVIWPFAATWSAVSCRVFWTGLGCLPAMQAHNLPCVVFVALLLLAVVRFSAARFGSVSGLAAGLILISSPRFFADGFNNLKDIPETTLYALAIMAGFRALTGGRRGWWIATGVLTGCALAQKPNALFIPVQLLAFILVRALRFDRRAEGTSWSWKGFGLGAAAFFACYFAASPQFWDQPVDNLQFYFARIFAVGNPSLGPLLISTAAPADPSGAGVFEPLLLALWTTPPVVIALLVVGICSRRLGAPERALLVLWVAVPLARTMLPGMVNFDGVRHYLEFYPPVAILAGIGVAAIVDAVRRVMPTRVPGLANGLAAAAFVLVLLPGAIETQRMHPHGVCYFNFLVGGLGGAQARRVPEATDYWAGSYWQGLAWLSRHAESGSLIIVPVAAQVAEFAAPERLRGDLSIWRDGAPPPTGPVYVMFVTRDEWYRPTTRRLIASRQPVHEIRVDGGVILRIYRFDAGPATAKAVLGMAREDRAIERVTAWLGGDQEKIRTVTGVFGAHRPGMDDVTIDRLRAVLPSDLADTAPELFAFVLPH